MMLRPSLVFALTTAAMSAPAAAVSVLDIYACYACQNTGNVLIDAALTANPSVAFDGILFAFVNTSGSAITNASFSVSNASPADSYNIGVVGAGATVIVMPGLSSDGGTHANGGLFATTGSTADTSDGSGGVSDSSIFVFAAKVGSNSVGSGNIVPGDPSLILPYRAPVGGGSTSFIGFGPSGDGGCSNCYYGKIGSAVLAVPEPGSLALYVAGLGILGAAVRRRAYSGPRGG